MLSGGVVPEATGEVPQAGRACSRARGALRSEKGPSEVLQGRFFVRVLTDSYIDENLSCVETLENTLAALADPTRRRIVDRLAQGEATVSELVACFDLTQPTISSHLRVLERSGLISRSRVAQTRPCRLEPKAFGALDAWLGQLRSIYEANYDRLDRVLDELKAQNESDSK